MRIAVASRSFSRHPVLRAELLERFPDVTFNDAGAALKGDELIAFLRGHQGAIIALEKMTADIFAALPELKVIGKFGVGYDNLDLHAMIRHGVELGWTGGSNKRSVSELAIAFAIALLRHIPVCHGEIAQGGWKLRVGRQLSDRTVGLIGCGHVGKDFARLLRAFGCRVLAHDIRDFPEFYAETGVEPVDLDTLLRDADVVSLHVPLDDSTRNMMSRERLAQMRPDAILLNVARGGLVDELTLKEMLRDGRLAGAAFDVFGTEPPADPELLRLPNFLASPHCGGSAEEAVLAMGRAAIDGLTVHRPPEPGVYPS